MSFTFATVLRDGATNYHATVSPDGSWLAYDWDRDGIVPSTSRRSTPDNLGNQR